LYEEGVVEAERKIDRFFTAWSNIPLWQQYLAQVYFEQGINGGNLNDTDAEENGNGNGQGDNVDANKKKGRTFKKKNWMVCFRQDVFYNRIDTNNLIESWHATLKMYFFKDKHQRRVDKVIYVLTHEALPFYQQKTVQSRLNVGKSSTAHKQMSTAIWKARSHLLQVGRKPQSLINPISRTVLSVESFSQANTRYEVTLDFSKKDLGEINYCSCPFFQSRRQCCKHIGLVKLAIPSLTFERKLEWEAAEWIPVIEAPEPLEPAPVALQLEPVPEIMPLAPEVMPELGAVPEMEPEIAPQSVQETVMDAPMAPAQEDLGQEVERLMDFINIFRNNLPEGIRAPVRDMLSIFEQLPQPYEHHAKKRQRQQSSYRN
jgi:hypothetical protein